MKDFTRPPGRLRSLPLAARVAYSVFAVFTLAALGFSVALAEDMVGPRLERAGIYYAGDPDPTTAAPRHASPAQSDGPEIDLPDEAEAPAAREPMPRRKLLEVTHFHLFSMPVYLLILSHLFMLGAMRTGTKVWWIGLGSLATAAHIAAPWISASTPGGAPTFYAVSGAALAVSYLVMTLVPLWEMWRPVPSAPTRRSGARDPDVGDG